MGYCHLRDHRRDEHTDITPTEGLHKLMKRWVYFLKICPILAIVPNQYQIHVKSHNEIRSIIAEPAQLNLDDVHSLWQKKSISSSVYYLLHGSTLLRKLEVWLGAIVTPLIIIYAYYFCIIRYHTLVGSSLVSELS